MPHAIRIHETGGPDKLRVDEVPVPAPRAGEVRLEVAAAGLNFIDVQFRTGKYPVPAWPLLWVESCGILPPQWAVLPLVT